MTPGGQSPMCWRSPKIQTHVLAITKNTNPLSHRTTTPFVYLCYTSLTRDGHHQKYECGTNFFVCLLVRRYRIDALPLPLVWFALHCGFKNRYPPCVTNPLVNTRPGRRFAQAALKSCGSVGYRDQATCPTFVSLNAELVACRTSKKRTKQHER